MKKIIPFHCNKNLIFTLNVAEVVEILSSIVMEVSHTLINITDSSKYHHYSSNSNNTSSNPSIYLLKLEVAIPPHFNSRCHENN